jgi:hypothetical protein
MLFQSGCTHETCAPFVTRPSLYGATDRYLSNAYASKAKIN